MDELMNELLNTLEKLSMVNKEDVKQAFKEYGYEAFDTLLQSALSNLEDLKEKGFVELYYEALEQMQGDEE